MINIMSCMNKPRAWSDTTSDPQTLSGVLFRLIFPINDKSLLENNDVLCCDNVTVSVWFGLDKKNSPLGLRGISWFAFRKSG